MHSEPTRHDSPSAPEPGSRWAWLYSQGLGILCGQATVLLLAVGSVVFAATRDGASAGIELDDLRGFFAEPSVVHLWLYLLFPVLALYGLNALLATWKSVVARWRNGIRAPRAYATAAIHLAFLVGLLAHLVGGIWGADQPPVLVGPTWTGLEDGRHARVAALDVDHLPGGAVKQVYATIELRNAEGEISESTLSYNSPFSTGLGSDLLLLLRPASVPAAARLVRDTNVYCLVQLEDSCNLGGLQVELLYLHPPARQGRRAMARVRLRATPAVSGQEFWLAQGQQRSLADGSSLSLEGIETRPAVLLRHRQAPGTPWALLAAVLLTGGLGLMWRRLV
jgi:hypothetical protein